MKFGHSMMVKAYVCIPCTWIKEQCAGWTGWTIKEKPVEHILKETNYLIIDPNAHVDEISDEIETKQGGR